MAVSRGKRGERFDPAAWSFLWPPNAEPEGNFRSVSSSISPFPASPELVAAFEAAPDDDAPLLVLADWLQERGHPWGELIAVQCGLAHHTGTAPERARLLRREHELISTRNEWWPYDGVGFHVESFVRGFPSRIRADNVMGLRTLVSRMPWLAADDIEVRLDENSMLGLVGLGRLPTRGFTFVSGHNYYFDLLDAKMFVRWLERHTIVLRRFGMHGMARIDALDRVFSTPMTRRRLEDVSLVNLQMGQTVRIPDVRRLSIAGGFSTWDGQARSLDVLEFAQWRADARAWDIARRLESASRYSLTEADLDDELAQQVIAHARPNIRVFGMAKNPITAATIERLVVRPSLTGAELWSTKIGDEGVEMLSKTSCEELDLANVGMTARGAQALANSSTLPPTLRLSLSTAEAGTALPALRERYAVVLAR